VIVAGDLIQEDGRRHPGDVADQQRRRAGRQSDGGQRADQRRVQGKEGDQVASVAVGGVTVGGEKKIMARIPLIPGLAEDRQRVGAGGDQTIYLDQLAEQIVLRHLEQAYRSGFRFRLISEELGEREFGGSPLVLVDPLDGSVNAKMGLPYYAVVLAVTEGDRFRDVRLGYVQNLVSGEEFHAYAGGGAFYQGEPLRPPAPTFD